MKDLTEEEDIRVSDQIKLCLEGDTTKGRPTFWLGTSMIGNTPAYKTLE